jgi:hypothetical protein
MLLPSVITTWRNVSTQWNETKRLIRVNAKTLRQGRGFYVDIKALGLYKVQWELGNKNPYP